MKPTADLESIPSITDEIFRSNILTQKYHYPTSKEEKDPSGTAPPRQVSMPANSAPLATR
jgi:hypothetical protein